MAILVVCPGCHKRFSVNDKFAGKKGPCPKCKTVITIPTKEEEVVIHGEESFGPTGASGKPVLKPISKEYTKFSPLVAVGAGMGVLAVVLLALGTRFNYEDASQIPLWILGFGAVMIAPPLVWSSYLFLNDDELEPHRGSSLWIRVAICSAVYALIWGVMAFVNSYAFDNDGFSLPILAVVLPSMVVAGAGVAFVSLDLEFFMGLFHYGLYLMVCVLLRLLVGMPAFPLAE